MKYMDNEEYENNLILKGELENIKEIKRNENEDSIEHNSKKEKTNENLINSFKNNKNYEKDLLLSNENEENE